MSENMIGGTPYNCAMCGMPSGNEICYDCRTTKRWPPDSQSDTCNVICPWCEAAYQAEARDFDEDERVEECFKCGKAYILYDEMEIIHHTRPVGVKQNK